MKNKRKQDSNSNNNNETLKKKRVMLSFGQKKELCLLHQQNPSLTYKELGQRFGGAKENTVCDILKQKDKWLEINNSESNKRRDRSPKFPQLEEALIIWITHALAHNRIITGEIILTKANQFATLLDIKDFHGSGGWLDSFKKRHNLKQYNKHGEAQSGPNEEELEEERKKLQEILSNYDFDDVFNCDETGNNFII